MAVIGIYLLLYAELIVYGHSEQRFVYASLLRSSDVEENPRSRASRIRAVSFTPISGD